MLVGADLRGDRFSGRYWTFSRGMWLSDQRVMA
jgi:hypothetical protein